MSEIALRGSEMSSLVCEASDLIKTVAGPHRSVKQAIGYAANRLGVNYNRAKDIWYADVPRLDAWELLRLREEAARREVELAVERVVALREALTKADPDFHRETISLLGAALQRMGCEVTEAPRETT